VPAIAKESPSFGLKGGESTKEKPVEASLFSGVPKKPETAFEAPPSSSGSLFGPPKEDT